MNMWDDFSGQFQKIPILFKDKGPIISLKYVFMFPWPVIAKGNTKKQKPKSLDFPLEVSRNMSALEQRFTKLWYWNRLPFLLTKLSQKNLN